MGILRVAHASNISLFILSNSLSKTSTSLLAYLEGETGETCETNSRLGVSSVSVVSVVSGKEGSRYRLTADSISERWYPLAPSKNY